MNRKRILVLFTLLSFFIAISCSNDEPSTEEISQFFYSILLNDIEKVETMLKTGFDPNVSNEDNQTALFYAVQIEHHDIALLLIENGAHYDFKTIGNNHLLIEASFRGATEVVEKLVNKGSYDLNEIGETNWPPLLEAIRFGHFEIVKLLLDNNADPNFADHFGWTALHEAAYIGDADLISLLLEQNADDQMKNDRGFTPLHVATLGGYHEVVEILLRYGSSIDETDGHGRTPLMIASEQGFLRVVDTLLLNGANTQLRGEDQKLAIELAEEWGYSDVVQLIKKYQ